MTITCVNYEENEDSCRFRVTAGETSNIYPSRSSAY